MTGAVTEIQEATAVRTMQTTAAEVGGTVAATAAAIVVAMALVEEDLAVVELVVEAEAMGRTASDTITKSSLNSPTRRKTHGLDSSRSTRRGSW